MLIDVFFGFVSLTCDDRETTIITSSTVTPSTSAATTPDQAVLPTSYMINCGGSAIVAGTLWGGDDFFSSGGTYGVTDSVAGSSNNPMYQSERYGIVAEGNLKYDLPLQQGSYLVRLHFAELFYTAVGARIFDIRVEGTDAVTDLDLIAVAGYLQAHVIELRVVLTDDELNLRFRFGAAGAPKINGIEISKLTV